MSLISCRTHNRLLYVDIPKGASSSIKIALQAAGMPAEKGLSWWHGTAWEEIDHAEIDFSFSFVRHPIARVISTYRMYKGHFPNRLGGATFDDFIDKVLSQDDDVHVRPQHLMLPAPGKLSFIGKFENLHHEWPWLQQQFPWLPTLPFVNVSLPAEITLSPSQEDALLQRYWEDFYLFGYHARHYTTLPPRRKSNAGYFFKPI